MLDILEYFKPEVCQQLQTAIANAQGQEFFSVGRLGDDGRIAMLQIVCQAGHRGVMMLNSIPESGDIILHNHATSLTPSSIDEKISRRFSGRGVGFYLVNNDVSEIYPMLEPFRGDEEIEFLEEEVVADVLGANGLIASKLPNYEERPEQIDMLRHLVRAFNDDNVLMVEAGTGTGKSLAYLIPSIYWAKKNRERVLISTGTINLQEQIFHKDIPFLKKVLDEPFEAVLVKGRHNYLCLRKLHQQHAIPNAIDDLNDRKQLEYLVKWAKKTTTGDRSELEVSPKQQLWSLLESETDACQRTRCEFYNSCFYYIARRQQVKAHLLITNHHIFFADLSLRESSANYTSTALLPPYQRIILDESHNIEDAASSFLGFQTTRGAITRALGMLLKLNRRKEEVGLLKQMAQILLNNFRFIPKATELRESLLEDLIPAIRQQRDDALRYAGRIHRLLVSDEEAQQQNFVKIRVTTSLIERGPWVDIRTLGFAWAENLDKLVHSLVLFGERLEKGTEQVEKQFTGLLTDLTAAINRLGRVVTSMRAFFAPTTEEENEQKLQEKNSLMENGHFEDDHSKESEDEEDELVRWFELRTHDPQFLKLQAAPLHIGQAMRRMLYDNFGSIIYTSATLATKKDDFSYINGRLGIDLLPQMRVKTTQFFSPFNYKKQVMIGIPSDIPNPKEHSFNEVIQELIFKALSISGGRAFVLSTSFKQLTYLYENLAPRLKQLGINSLCQGKAQRHLLLKQKIEDEQSVLFGTDSFWEGVDVRGQALNNVILTRLPFRVPSEPLTEARLEAIDKKGQNSFLQYTVPTATIKFKQGFGRLIRSKDDFGTVLILDKRVIEKNYGKQFLATLPTETKKIIGTSDYVLSSLSDFYEKMSE